MNASEPTSPPTSPRDDVEVDLLLRFVHERDVLCPRCGYNLRNLTQPTCPECRETLSLKVGAPRVPLALLLLAIVPGAFCAVALGIFIFMCALHGPPPARETALWLIVGFFGLSAATATAIALGSRWFLRMPPPRQLAIGLIIWVAHIAVFLAVATAM